MAKQLQGVVPAVGELRRDINVLKEMKSDQVDTIAEQGSLSECLADNISFSLVLLTIHDLITRVVMETPIMQILTCK